MLHVVTAIVKPHKLDDVIDAVTGVGVQGLTVTEARGFGRQRGRTETYRGTEYRVDLLPKLRVEVLCPTEDAEKVAEAIAAAGRTGKIGDGKVWITPVDRAIRVRTGERGTDAV
ncbi:MAG: P-II family nitrogen regulator [Acidimicrobiales bacterium]